MAVITLLSPLDVKPGAQDPSGRTVVSVKEYFSPEHQAYVVDAVFDDGSHRAFMWPTGKGWLVDGKLGE